MRYLPLITSAVLLTSLGLFAQAQQKPAASRTNTVVVYKSPT